MADDPFEAVVGADHCYVPADEKLDGVPVSRVVCPGTAEEVAACLAKARESGRPIVASGAGSKLAWGNRAEAKALMRVDLKRLGEQIELQAEEGIVTVQAGVPVQMLEHAAAERGKRTLLCTLYPGATVGGTIAVDPSGLEFAPDWRLRNDVLGLQVAHPDGQLERCGGQVVKNVTGFDLVRLYCGSFGTLGVITEATLRLRPLPEARRLLCRDFETREAAFTASRELLPCEPRAAILRPQGNAARLLWMLEGGEADVAQRARDPEGARLEAADWAQVCAEAADLAPRPEAAIRIKVSARASDVSAICTELVDLAGQASLRLALPLVGIVVAEVPEAMLLQILERAQEQRWTVFVERATLEQKARIDVFWPAPEALPLMRALKQRFDPDRILSPGRFVGGI